MMEDIFLPVIICGMLFVALPWMILHYVTKWKTTGGLTNEDEMMLDQMHDTARRLEERLSTIERIIAADNPDFRPAPRPADDNDTDYRFDRRN